MEFDGGLLFAARDGALMFATFYLGEWTVTEQRTIQIRMSYAPPRVRLPKNRDQR